MCTVARFLTAPRSVIRTETNVSFLLPVISTERTWIDVDRPISVVESYQTFSGLLAMHLTLILCERNYVGGPRQCTM